MDNVKASYLKVSKELEREKRAKEIMEQICDELARGIGEDRAQDLELYLNKTTSWEFHNLEEENDINVGDGIEHENDSAESDLQSIELNMDNDSKSYKWSYACENVEAKRISIDKDIGRKSFSERIQWGSICFNKGTSNGKKRDFGVKIQEGSDQLDQERSIEFLFGAKIQEGNEETESYRPIMSLRDCLSFPNPAQRSGQPLTLHYIDGEAGENAVALEGHNLKQDPALRK
ncbi:hypothetical protein SESBI_23463 [Sesbania bispinosa]|nr:hypothetical protein SESBI_23463 [Sesbania bispinosa]